MVEAAHLKKPHQPRASLPGNSRTRLPTLVLALGILLGVLVLALAAGTAWVERQKAIADASTGISKLNNLLSAYVRQSMLSGSLVLDGIATRIRFEDIRDANALRSLMSRREIHQMLRDKISGVPQIDVATIVDDRGKVIAFSRSFPVPEINLADRDYFILQKNRPARGIYVSEPVRNRGTGEYAFYISQRLDDASGNFMGMVLVGFSVKFFNRFYEESLFGTASSIFLLRDDYVTLARAPHRQELIGKTYLKEEVSKIVEASASRSGVSLSTAPILHEPHLSPLRIFSARAIQDFPLVVGVWSSEDDFLSEWRKHTLPSIALISSGGLLMVLLSTAALFVVASRREALLAELSRAKDLADASNRAKAQFVANMSHEIRTPMNAIVGLAYVLQKNGKLNPESRGYVDKIASAADYLLAILSNVLDLSKIEAGKMELETEEFKIDELLLGVRSLIEERVTEKGLNFSIDATRSTSPIRGDVTRIKQMLVNYLSNAVKFTERGSIRVSVSVLEESGAALLLRFAVSDTGMGIREEHRPRLFNAFEQADNTITRRFGGTGLGLSVTAQLARLLGGEAGYEPNPGGGSIFWFTVRVFKTSSQPLPPQGDHRPAGSSIASKPPVIQKVLVAEDDQLNRELTEALLLERSLSVEFALDGEDALEKAGRTRFDLVLMDLHMPQMDGIETTKALRKLPGYSGTPIIAITADAFGGARKACLEAGMTDHLTKPINPMKLFNILDKWLSRPAG